MGSGSVFPAVRPAERGRATASEMLRVIGVLGSTNAIAPFLDSYAAQFNRPGLKAHSVQYRELLATIGREALLAMSAKMMRELPRRFGGSKDALLRGDAAAAADAFREEFFDYLTRALDWTPADRNEFLRDLELYAQLGLRELGAGSNRERNRAASPFADRCALLLDPSMMPEARQAAGRFLTDLEARAEKILRQVFRARRKT